MRGSKEKKIKQKKKEETAEKTFRKEREKKGGDIRRR